MGTIAQELARIQNAKASLKTSIENKGVQVPANTLIDGYPALVDQISGGGGVNPFDHQIFERLLLRGRFCEDDTLDMIYNSDGSILKANTEKNFKYMADILPRLTLAKMQKIFNIVEKFANSGTKTTESFQSAFSDVIPSGGGTLTFAPTISKTGLIDFASLFYNFNNGNSSQITLDVDFNNVYSSGGYSYANAFYLKGNYCKAKLHNIPVNALQATTNQFGINSSGSRNAIEELTFKGAVQQSNKIILICSEIMTSSKWTECFQSLDPTSYSNVTIKVPSTVYSTLTSDQIAILTDKGYLLASA